MIRTWLAVRVRRIGVLLLICLVASHPAVGAEAPAAGEMPVTTEPTKASNALDSAMKLFASDNKRRRALRDIRRRCSTDMVAPLIVALRHLEPDSRAEVLPVLQRITGERGIDDDWFRWMVWQQRHPEVVPFPDFILFQYALYTKIDPNFAVFFDPRAPSRLRREEITWGGVVKDGIPALNQPTFIAADAADYLSDDDPVFGVSINGDARAYPYRIMDWHEMANDTVGGVPVALAYCTLCGSAILYRTDLAGFDVPLLFGSSGFLYRSNKLMYDQSTHTLWNQFTGEPAVGSLTEQDLVLPVLPLVTTRWGDWRRLHPDTQVLDPETGYERSYKRGAPYRRYFKSSELMFPAAVDDQRLAAKSEIFGLRISGAEKAWPLSLFKDGRVLNDQVGVIPLVIIGDAKTRTVRAYRRGKQTFEKAGGNLGQVASEGALWEVEEAGLRGPGGELLPRLPGHLAYWFAWDGYLDGASLYGTGAELEIEAKADAR